MSNSSIDSEDRQRPYYEKFKEFPPVQDGKIQAKFFLEAAIGLVAIIERLGKVFAPVKYDMQGNINKIVENYEINENACLLELMSDDSSEGKLLGRDGVLWLNRALLFFELLFQQMIRSFENEDYDFNLKKAFTIAYEGSVKKYHNWMTQKLFYLICTMSPKFSQVMKCLEVETNNMNHFETILRKHHNSLHMVRCKLDEFFQENT